MQNTLAELAKIVEGEVVGDASLVITALNGIKEAQAGELSFLANAKYLSLAKETKASALLVPRDTALSFKNLIRVANPSLAFAQLIQHFMAAESFQFQGIHPSAYVDPTARLGQNVSVGPCAIIEPDVEIGDGSIIGGGCSVGHHTKIGTEARLQANVTLGDHTELGNRVVIHSGTVIGADGFGFEQVEGIHEKIPQLGNVVIEDDVEIGANVTIDRARFKHTRIGQGTKIDNLVQIGHNCTIGKNCIIVSLVGISGSTTIEDNCILAGQAGFAGHLTVGKGAIVVGKAGVISDVPPGEKVMGYPAKPYREAVKINAAVQKLPEYVKTIAALEKRIAELEKKLKNA